jgi:hypothetical protein
MSEYIVIAPVSINEGSVGTFNVETTDVPNGTTLYWNINHISSSSGDFAENNGAFVVTSNAGLFVITPFADFSTEGAQTFTVSVRTGGITGPVVAISALTTVNDTSLTPTYAFVTTPGSIVEGASGIFDVVTTNVVNNTTLYWTLNLTTSASNDFFNTSGPFTIDSNSGSFLVSVLSDSLTETTESFSVSIRTDSTSGPIVATSTSVNVINVVDILAENYITQSVTVTGLGLYTSDTIQADFLRRAPSYTTNVDPRLPKYDFLTSNLVIWSNAEISVNNISLFPVPSSISSNSTVFANTFLSNGAPIDSGLLVPLSDTRGLRNGDRIVTANITSQANSTIGKIYANGNILIQNLSIGSNIVIGSGETCYFYPRNFSYRNIKTVRSDTLSGNVLILTLESLDDIRIGSLVSTANIASFVGDDTITTVRKLFAANNSVLVQNIDANLTVSVGEYVNLV